MSDEELIRVAASVLSPREVDGRWFGDVGSALVTEDGNQYGVPDRDDRGGVAQ